MAAPTKSELAARLRAVQKSLAREKAKRTRAGKQLTEAFAQQAATAEILHVISSSPTEVQPVFEAIASSAARLCDATFCIVFRFDGEMISVAADDGRAPGTLDVIRAAYPSPPGRQSVAARAIAERRVISIADAQKLKGYPQQARRARAIGYRSILAVPMMRGDAAIGCINVARFEAIPFSDTQVALLKSFADQAVIAIENVRLFNETKEALERQTATAEILKVISGSPTDVQPVFDAIVRSAVRLINGFSCVVSRIAGEYLHLSAFTSIDSSRDEGLRDMYPAPIARRPIAAEVVRTGLAQFIADLQDDPRTSATWRDVASARGYRSVLVVPMLREGAAIGLIFVTRVEPGPFSDHHIELLQTFADQAVIAIENVRLFNGTKEALERQTATADILRVISGSPTDTQPVFEVILERATKLCDAETGILFGYDSGAYQAMATRIPDPEFAAAFREPRRPRPGSKTGLGRLVREKRTVHITDVLQDAAYAEGDPMRLETARAGVRTWLGVPLLKEGALIGAIVIYRNEPRAFSEQQVSLLETFADQAVIAIENVRLFNGTKEALERQTATAEILGVIASSPSDVQPVFDMIAQNAVRVCGTSFSAVCRFDGEKLHLAAVHNLTPAAESEMRRRYPMRPDPAQALGRVALSGSAVCIEDTRADPGYDATIANAGGWRRIVAVPMRRGGDVLGAIGVAWSEPGRISDNQIDLLKSFADQAVIAIENVRLFNETKEALERQTATAEILNVISRSPTDVQPVFEAIVRSGVRLFEDAAVAVVRAERGEVRLMAIAETDRERSAKWQRSFPFPLTEDYIQAAAILRCRMVEVSDVLEPQDEFVEGRRNFQRTGYRALTAAPMVRDGVAIGAISVVRLAPGPLSERQKALLRTFADQAVIAIENVRLFNETKEALERQTATAEILKVIAASPTDIQPVLDAVSESAARLCEASDAAIFRNDGEQLCLVAHRGPIPYGRIGEYAIPVVHGTVAGRTMLEARTVHVKDLQSESVEFPEGSEIARQVGHRTTLCVPLLRNGVAIGAINVRRTEARLFTERQVALLETFADQAVIAIENVRLFNETKEALERQTATAEILKVIASSPSDVLPVLDAVAENAARLCEAEDISILEQDGAVFRVSAFRGASRLKDFGGTPVSRGSVAGRAVIEGQLVHVHDITAASGDEFPVSQSTAAHMGHRTMLAMPLLREGASIGAIFARRTEVRPFSERQIALLRTFADQAVIAIENVRLFNETKESLERQTATAEILQVIGSSPTDTQPVFDAIVNSGVRLFPGAMISVARPDGGTVRAAAIAHQDTTMVAGWRERLTTPLSRDRLHAAAILDAKLIDFPDAEAEKDGPLGPGVRNFLLSGNRAVTIMPMLRGEGAIGAISVTRAVPGPLSDKQIAMLRTFADQAVIAIENVRLFNETKEALERQTATAEILKVIASSPADVQPVFDAIVETAKRLIGAFSATVTHVGDGMLHLVAHTATTPEGAEALNRYFPIPVEGTPMGRAILLRRPEFIDDFEADTDDARDGRELARSRGFKSVVFVPLMRGGAAIGSLNVTRREAGRMAGHQIDLLKTFADQAVIAIENVRLFNETKEALERQTATAEILRVISSSPTDTQPVFEAIVQSGLKLFPNAAVVVTLPDGDRIRLAAMADADPLHAAQWKKRHDFPLTREYMHAVAILDGTVIDVPDAQAYEGGPLEAGIRNFLATGNRAITIMPMLRADEVIGTISVIRLAPGPLTEKQLALLRTFADQAVIAIENVRLFNETKEALERQTATAEILKVIASSPADVQPVFDVIVESAVRLCAARMGRVYRYDGALIQMVAAHGLSASGLGLVRQVFPRPAADDTIAGQVMLTRRPYYVVDIERAEAVPALSRQMIEALATRSQVTIPMLRAGEPIGAITLGWAEPDAFDDQQVALLQTFADQAVIAIENVRLFNETKEALERQTATAEILQVIAGSPSDVQPVFDAIVQSAIRLVPPWNAAINMRDGDVIQMRAAASPRAAQISTPRFREFFPMPFDPEANEIARCIAECRVIESPDSQAPGVNELLRKLATVGRYRSGVLVPLIHKGTGIGVIGLTHPEPNERLTDKQMELISTFANQAVIAIENVRLFNETKEALERQTATAEILKVIASSPSDVQPVFDAIARSAHRLIGAHYATVTRCAGDELHLVAHTATPMTGDAALERLFPAKLVGQGTLGKAVLSGEPAWISDVETDEAYSSSFRAAARARGYRSLLAVPMIRDGDSIGTISVTRSEPGAFSERQVSLLKTFADQAVIAIENVRLFNETREALERQTATAEILQVIGSSPTDTQPVFDAIVNSGVRLFPGAMITVARPDGEIVRAAAIAHEDTTMVAGWRARFTTPLSRDRLHAAAILDAKLIDFPDAEAEKDGPLGPGVRNFLLSGNRAVTIMPMLRGEGAIGAISVTRAVPGPLSDKQIAILRTFADQAVIAIENVRLFKELQSRTEALTRSVGQLTALGEVGQAISSSLDLETVLKTIVSRAVQLTGLDAGGIYEYDERAEEFHLRAAENMDDEIVEILRSNPIRKGEGAVGGTAVTRAPIQVPETQAESYQSRLRELLVRTGRRALLAVPLLREDHIIGALAVQRNTPGPFAPEVVELLQTFATQSAMAIQNARLFREIAEKGKQLEVASRHKSDFLASMSHELRTPLNAILGFNEMILGEVYGDVPADMKEPLSDIQASGKHLLRLINNVLDLAKIEAGRMELAPQEYAVQDVVESVRSTLRPLAVEKGLEFLASVPNDIPLAYGDAGRITQCLMNLAGNSLKFTKAGKVEITVEWRSEVLIYQVADTGIGIAPEKIDSLFTEFKQSDATIAGEYGGTGLGLSISRKFVEMHGGRIWVESEPGKGSAFLFEIPLRLDAGAAQ